MIRILSFSILLISILFTYGCGSSDPGSGFSEDDQKIMLENTADNIILPAYLDLKNQTQVLAESVNTFNTTVNLANLNAVKNQLKIARLSWQNCNMYDFGPASSQGLTTYLNIFPANDIDIEKNIIDGNFSIDILDANDQRGFQAIAYLIYGEDKTESEILTSFESENRKQYLKTVTDRIAEKADAVHNSWDASGENYINTFKSETGIDVGSSLGILLNAVIQSMERKTRDGKIGIPVGLRSLGDPVPERIEALYAGYSLELLNKNLMAYYNLFNGVTSENIDQEGILDYLSKVSDNDLRTTISNQFTSVIQTAQTISEPLNEEVVINPTPTNNAVAELQKLLIILKTDLTSTLNISITYQDNDGD